MNAKQECERLRAENDMLRADLGEAIVVLCDRIDAAWAENDMLRADLNEVGVAAAAVGDALAGMGEHVDSLFTAAAAELAAAVTAAEARPRAASHGRGFNERQIRATVQELRKRRDRAPTIALVASELHTSEATLKRALKDLGLGPWPPAPSED